MVHPYEFALAIEISRFLQELSHHAKSKGKSIDQAAYQFVQLMQSDPKQASEAVQELIAGFNNSEPMMGKVTIKSALSRLLESKLSDEDVETAVSYVLKTVLVTVATQAGRVDIAEVVHNSVSIIRTVSQASSPPPPESAAANAVACGGGAPHADEGEGEAAPEASSEADAGAEVKAAGEADAEAEAANGGSDDDDDDSEGEEDTVEEAKESLKDKLKEAEAKAADVLLGSEGGEVAEAAQAPKAEAEPSPATAAEPAAAAPAPIPVPAPATRTIRLPAHGSDARSVASRATAVSAAKSMQDPGLIRTILNRVRSRR